jgi:hypothetical protein
MLKRKTTVVVGAGASVDFGLPTGPQLIEQIHHLLTDPNNRHGFIVGGDDLIAALRQTASESRHQWGDLYKAGQKLGSLLRGQPVSIDNVVHTHSEDGNLVTVAKVAIALTILDGERKGPLREQSPTSLSAATHGQENWLHYFLVRHFTGYTLQTRRESLTQLRFIIFNYDRCVEQILRQVYANHFHLDDKTAVGELSDVTIVHPYGHLGELPSSGFGGEFAYGQQPTSKVVCDMSKRLRTFTEGIDDPALHSQVHGSVSWADAIVFVGFGYLALNRRLLRNDSIRERHKVVFGSAFKMPKESAIHLKTEISREFNSTGALGFDPAQRSKEFLQEYEQFLFE